MMKDIKNYEGKYAITDNGRVWSYKSQKFLATRLDKDGYERVTLSKNSELKTFHIHTLVAEAFIPNINNLPEINHKDENKLNNKVSNLEYCTHEYNVNYGTRNERASASLKNQTRKGKKLFCPELNEFFKSQAEASRKYNIQQSEISKCCSGKRNYAGKHPITNEPLTWEMVA